MNSINCFYKTEKVSSQFLSFHLNPEQTRGRISITMRAEMNEIENKKSNRRKLVRSKSSSLKKINKIKPVVRVIQGTKDIHYQCQG